MQNVRRQRRLKKDTCITQRYLCVSVCVCAKNVQVVKAAKLLHSVLFLEQKHVKKCVSGFLVLRCVHSVL